MRWGWVVLTLSVLACGAPTATDAVDTDSGAQDGTWQTLDHAERIAYMTDVVLPAATELMDGSFPGRFSPVGCETCHGADAAEVSYAMPNGVLGLYTGYFPPSVEASDDNSSMVLFMSEALMPMMADLLDQDVIDLADPLGPGFGCYNCHEVLEGDPPERDD